jgi:PAS domain S-box-containing protein
MPHQKKQFIVFAAILSGIVIMAGSLALWLLYEIVWRHEQQRLEIAALTHARFIETLAQFKRTAAVPETQIRAQVVAEVRALYPHMFAAPLSVEIPPNSVFDNDPHIVLFARSGEHIEILARHCRHALDCPNLISYHSNHALLMRRALAGDSGVDECPDCMERGRILAAYRPIAGLDLGLLSYADIADLRRPFWLAAVLAGIFGAVLIALGGVLFFRFTSPMFKEIQKNAQKYQRLLESLDAIVYQFSTQYGALYWSPQIQAILGFAPQDFYQQPYLWSEAIHPDDRGRVAHAMDEAKKGRFFALEYRIKDRDGHWHWFSDHMLSSIKNENEFIIEGVARDISARKHAEREQRLSAYALDASINAVAMADLSGHLSYVNRAFLDLWGYDEAREVLGRESSSFLQCPEEGDEIIATLHKQGVFSGELTGLRRDGTLFYVQISATRVPDEKGTPQALFAAFVDVSARCQAENNLQHERDLFNRIAETSPVGIVTLDSSGQISYANSQAEQILGLEKAQLSARTYRDPAWHICADNGAPMRPEELPFARVMAEKRLITDVRHSICLADGRTRFLSINAAPLAFAADGQVAGVISAVMDISAQHFAEQARQDSELQYRTLFEKMLDGFALHEIITNAEGMPVDYRFLDVNPAFTQQTGLCATEVVGSSVREIMPEIEEWWIKTYADVAFTGQALRFEQYSHVLGKHFEVVVFSPRAGQFATIFQDISARKQNEQLAQRARSDLEKTVAARTRELVLANDKLQHLSQLKNEFLASVSHELRSPLNTILTHAEVLQEGLYGDLSPKQARAVSQMAESGRHLLSLINDILDVAKIEAGKVSLDLQPVSPGEVCQSCVNLIKEQVYKKHLHLHTHFDPLPAMIEADSRRLKQMLINLLSNALKFTPEGGDIGFTFRHDAAKRQLYFRVWDSGIGIPAAQLDKLFQPFVQVDSSLSRQYNGTGLGLVLVKQLADLHGGSVHLDSSEGEGSCFEVILPWRDVARVGHDDEAAKPAPGKASSLRILLVDDNLNNRDSLSAYLQFKGHTVISANDGATAIQQARAQAPQIILMDIQMPGMDGLEAIHHLRADARLLATPIIALTALVMPGDRERCLAAGANAYLSKPVVLRELLDTIETLCKGA